MGKWKLYQYEKCSTCRKAVQFLEKKSASSEVNYDVIDIKTQPPTISELRKMLQFVDGNLKKLFNTSGIQYRELNLSEKLPGMSIDKALTLLSENGMLVKRPFLLGAASGAVGFKEPEWKKLL